MAFSTSLEDVLHINLKKSVRSVVVNDQLDEAFKRVLDTYIKKLNNLCDVNDKQNIFKNIRHRVKQEDAIQKKILFYMTAYHEYGKIPLNKCLNDLLGFRILVDDLESVFNALRHDRYVMEIAKMYFRIDGDYQGIHLYFKNGNNKFFP